ncbi:hypothetical protein ACFL43_04515 [Thermodesulfobacteriota bacterium]
MSTIASIDIGSQTIRLLVAEADSSGGFTPIYRNRAIIRLGEAMSGSRMLLPAAIERGVACIADFTREARARGAAYIYPVATACVRNAENAAAFLDQVHRAAGVAPAVLSGTEEARLSLLGVHSVYPSGTDTSLVIDIGGGSTECILLHNGRPGDSESMHLGVIALAETHLQHDPPQPAELESLREDIQAVLQHASRLLPDLAAAAVRPVVIGTAGTATTLAAMNLALTDYHPERINRQVLSYAALQNLLARMICLPAAERSRLPGLEAGRAVVIIPGTLIILSVLDLLQAGELRVSDAGLLEGVIIDALQKKSSGSSV